MMAAQTLERTHIAINGFSDVVKARRLALDAAIGMGFAVPEATKIAVVVSELGRNIVLYVGSGAIMLLPNASDRSFKLVAYDEGPGIEDVGLAMSEGYTTSNGLGLGLSGAKKMMDEFELWSVTGVGTRITAVKYLS